MHNTKHSRRSFLSALGAFSIAAGFRFPASAAEEKRLNFYNWDTYIGETTLDDFRAATGVEVSLSLFADDAELFAKMREGNSGYDVILPTDFNVERMWKAGLVQQLDHGMIPNFRNIAPQFQDVSFDPGRRYSMPYMWGTLGIGYRKSKVAKPESWGVIWGPESDQYAGRLGWINHSEAMLGMALRYLGYSFNATDPGRIKAAADQLIKYKKNAKGIFDDNGQDLLASGEVDLTVEWNGDIAQLISEDPDIGYAIPADGGMIWGDGLCIPAGAPHPQNAHAFINFLLDAEAGRDLAEYIQYATANAAARALMGDAYNNNPAIFPPDELTTQLEPASYLGETRSDLVEREWTRVLSA